MCSNNVLVYFYSKEYIWWTEQYLHFVTRLLLIVTVFCYMQWIILDECSYLLDIGMDAFWQDSNAVIYLVLSIYIYGSKVGAHYRSTLYADLNLEITHIAIWSLFIPHYSFEKFMVFGNRGSKIQNLKSFPLTILYSLRQIQWYITPCNLINIHASLSWIRTFWFLARISSFEQKFQKHWCLVYLFVACF